MSEPIDKRIKIDERLWPDILDLIHRHEKELHLNPEGAVHAAIRRYYNQPPIKQAVKEYSIYPRISEVEEQESLEAPPSNEQTPEDWQRMRDLASAALILLDELFKMEPYQFGRVVPYIIDPLRYMVKDIDRLLKDADQSSV